MVPGVGAEAGADPGVLAAGAAAGDPGEMVVNVPAGFRAFGRGRFACWKLIPHRLRHSSPPVPVASESGS